MDYINTGLYRFIYGLYQYRIIPIMNEWNEYYIPYSSTWKRYNHYQQKVQCKPTNKQPHNAPYHITTRWKIQPLQYYYIPYRTRTRLQSTIYFNSTTYHHITLPQDERTTANNIFIPERPQPIKCRTIYHRWNYTTIQNHFNITGHYITR